MRRSRRQGGALRMSTAFTLGAVVGSIASLLYAPTSGRVVRKRFLMRAASLKRAAARRLAKTQRGLRLQAEQVCELTTGWITEHAPSRNGNGRHAPTPRRHRVIRHAAAHR